MKFINNKCTAESVKKILPLDVSNYLNAIRTKKLKDGREVNTSTSYRATAYSALKNFFEFLRINKVIKENPISEMKRPKVTDDVSQEHLTIKQMRSVVKFVQHENAATKRNSITHEDHLRSRNVAIIRMLLELGIRCSALICIDVDNLDLKNQKIIYRDKGEKVFEKPLSRELAESLEEWLVDREKMEPNTNALFVSEKKKRCCYGTIANVVKQYTKAAIGNEMSVHKMRHSAITAMYELNGNDIVQASKFAGHSNVTTTQRYINTDYSKKEIELSAKLGSMI